MEFLYIILIILGYQIIRDIPAAIRQFKNKQLDLNQSGYGYDELKDFDDGYKGSRRSRITPFRGPLK
jgi:hypothetical protein